MIRLPWFTVSPHDLTDHSEAEKVQAIVYEDQKIPPTIAEGVGNRLHRNVVSAFWITPRLLIAELTRWSTEDRDRLSDRHPKLQM